MSSARIIRCYEYERLKVGREIDGHTFTSDDLNGLQRIHESQSLYFDLIHNGVQFKNYVGVLHMQRLTIEILPKADNHPSDKAEVKQAWSYLLIEMLRISGLSKVGSVGKAHQRLRNNSLLELYLHHFLNECEEVLRIGLVKSYRMDSGNVAALKGQIVFNKQIQNNLIRKDRIYTRHQVYDHDHLVNHVLFEALKIVELLAINSSMKSRSRRILADFPSFKSHPTINATTINRIAITRKLHHYEDALGLAKLILLNFSPDLRRGTEDVLAILFDMNMLWERFIFRSLQRGLKGEGYKVSYQDFRVFWNHRRVKPDIVLTTPAGDQIVIDTKWKLIRDGKPSDADLKQMFVYNLYWKTNRSILLYPGDSTHSGNWGRFYEGKPRPDVDESDVYHYCKVSTLKIWEETNGRPQLSPTVTSDIVKFSSFSNTP